MKKRLAYLFVMVAVIIASYVAGSWNSRSASGESVRPAAKTVLYYQCPMHPGFKSDKPGTAPCCGMEMVPVYAGDEGAAAESQPSVPKGAIHVSSEKQQTIGLRTGVVEKTDATRSIRLLGRVAADETRVFKLRAAVDGIIQEVHPVTTGSMVKKGDPLASYYSPDIYAAEQGYLIALSSDRYKSNLQVQVTASRLQFLGMDAAQIEELQEKGQITEDIVLHAPASGFVLSREVSPEYRFQKGEELYRIAALDRVWILADIYEGEARYLRPGVTARVSHPQLGKEFHARVSDVLPLFDDTTRTLKVRLDVDNPGNVLRPDMFVDVEFPLDLPASLTVPADAVLDTGMQKTVFVDLGNGSFEPRRVETGWRMGDRVEIRKGLMEGDRIVVSGNFLIDSESRLQGLSSEFHESETIDPVCGMKVDLAKAGDLKSVAGGETYYFCSKLCKEKFEKNPAQYLSK